MFVKGIAMIFFIGMIRNKGGEIKKNETVMTFFLRKFKLSALQVSSHQ